MHEDEYDDLYGGTPPHNGVDTSEDAAESMRSHALRMRETVFGVVERAGYDGITCDAIEVCLRGRHQTISARVRELFLLGRVERTGERRPTRSGRMAHCYRTVYDDDDDDDDDDAPPCAAISAA